MAKALSFSVGIPTYNQADYLEATLLSLFNQTRPPDEIVVSDHFSTDATPQILAKYSNRIRIVKPPAGATFGEHWDYTISCLQGDWFTLFSSDDIAYPNFVETLLEGATRRDDAVLVRAGWDNIDRDGHVIDQRYLLSVAPVTLPPETLLEQRYNPKVSAAAFAVRRRFMSQSGGYPIAMESFGDWPMFAQLAPYGSFVYEAKIIAGYRMGHGGDKFRSRLAMWIRDEQRMFNEVFPLAASRANMTDTSWIAEASRANFCRYLRSASHLLTLEECAAFVPVFEPWAISTGCDKLLELFAQGKPLPTSIKSLFTQGKKRIRPLANKVKSTLRRS